MAVTHRDFERRREAEGLEVSSQRGLVLMILAVLCAFAGFVLCLAAEATRSEATWFLLTRDNTKKTYECYYGGSGRTPLVCAAVAFFMLAVAMFIEHTFVVMTIGGPRPPALVAWSLREHDSDPPPSAARLRWEACALFLSTWVCFAVSEVLLVIGISVEASHLSNWSSLRANCVVARPGLFAAAGVFGLAGVFLAAALYLTALKAQRLSDARRQQPRHVPEDLATAPFAPPQPEVAGVNHSSDQVGSAHLGKS